MVNYRQRQSEVGNVVVRAKLAADAAKGMY